LRGADPSPGAWYALIHRALERGVRVEGVDSFRIAPTDYDPDATATLLLGYGGLAEPAIAAAVALLAEATRNAAFQRRGRGHGTNSLTAGATGGADPAQTVSSSQIRPVVKTGRPM
jgi:hypothetical protein